MKRARWPVSCAAALYLFYNCRLLSIFSDCKANMIPFPLIELACDLKEATRVGTL